MQHRRGARRALLVLGALLVVLVAGAPPAPAAVGPGTSGAGIILPNYYSWGDWRDKWVGAHDAAALGMPSASGLAWCIELGVNSGPGAASVLTNPAVSFLLWRNEHVNTAEYRAAIQSALYRGGFLQDAWQLNRFLTRMNGEGHANVLALGEAMWSEAMHLAGPFSAGVGNGSMTFAADHRSGTVSGIGVKAASGAWLDGVPWTLTLTGPAVWSSTGTKTLTGTTGTAPATASFRMTASGTVRATFGATGLPSSTVWHMTSGTYQDMVASFGTTSLSSDTAEHPVDVSFQPVASTVVGAKFAGTGVTDLTDRVTVSAAPGATWPYQPGTSSFVPVRFDGTLYRLGSQPMTTPAGSVPAGATVVGTRSFTANGPGVHTISAPKPAGTTGFFTWQWKVVKANQPTTWRSWITSDWADDAGLAAETTLVPWTPQVSTVASVTSDGILSDRVQLSGFPADYGSFTGGAGFGADRSTVAVELFFFPDGQAVTDPNLSASTRVGGTTVPASNGTHTATHPSFQVSTASDGNPIPGTYVFRASFAGSDRAAAFTSSVTETAEQVYYAPTPVTATTTAVADRDVLLIGDLVTVQDTATVTGTVPPGATITFDLYTWPVDTDPVCDADTLVWTSDPVTLTGPGDYTSPTHDLEAPGTLGFVESIHGPDGELITRGMCGVASETLVPLVVTTDAVTAAEHLVVGHTTTVWDVATVAGAVPDGATITFDLYTWPVYTDPACDADTLVWTSDPVTLTGPGEYTSGVHELTVPGVLGFVESVHDADGELIATGVCGVASETLVPLEVTTVAATAAEHMVVGHTTTVWDVATVAGTVPDGSSVSFELFTWPVDSDPVCDADTLVWTSDPVILDGPGEYASPTHELTVPGTLGFVESVHDAAGELIATGVCGVASETLVPLEVTTVAATAAEHMVVGHTTTVWDVATVAGTVPDGSSVSFELFTWPVDSDPVCDAESLLWTSDPVTLTGPGDYTSATYELEVPGVLGFVESVHDRDGNLIARGGCGVASETLTPVGVTTVAMTDTSDLLLDEGAAVWDTAEVTGLVPDGATMSFALYAWPVDTDPACDADTLVWTSDPVTLDGPGRYTSPEHALDVPGTLGFVESVHDTDGELITRGVCGIATETLVPREAPRTATSDGGAALDLDETSLPVTGSGGVLGAGVTAVLTVLTGLGLMVIARRPRGVHAK